MIIYGKCEFCLNKAPLRIPKTEQIMGIEEDTYVCETCWKLMQNPRTALPLIRGHLTLSLRGTIPPKQLDKMINNFMEKISAWKPRVKN